MAEKLIGYVYKIENKVNGKVYVGQTSNLKERRTNHFSGLRTGKHVNPILQNAFNKHGEHNFAFDVLEEVQATGVSELALLLELRESQWIQQLDSIKGGYNICAASCSRLGVKLTDAQKLVIKKASTGRKHTAETRAMLSDLAKNRSLEHRSKLSEAALRQSAETRAKISAAHKGRIRTPEHCARLSVSHKARNQRLKQLEVQNV